MKFKKTEHSKEFPNHKALVFEDKCGDVLTVIRQGDEGDIFIHVNGGSAVWLKRRRAIRLALMILDELDPGHTWAP